MFSKNGFRSSPGWLFGFVDSLLILIGITLGSYLRFWGGSGFSYMGDYLIFRIMLIVLVVQVVFYYFDLYDAKTLKGKKRMGILLLGSLGASSIFLTVIYYFVPFLTMGRGVFSISMFFILILTLSWRLIYSLIIKELTPKERILIIGTGELAKKIKSEIIENGYEGFEIVGFIDENRDKIGRSI